MKKIGIVLLMVFLTGLLMGDIQADRQGTLKSIYQLYGQQKYDEVLPMIEKAIKEFGSLQELLKLKFNIFVAQKRYDAALAFINNEIKKSGETEPLLAAKFELLFRWGKLKEALEIAQKKDKITKPKSPWDSINIMHVYLRMGKKQDALDSLQEAVSRGFINYRILTDKKYISLAKETRFYEIIETIKVAIGLGYPARSFSAKLLDGEPFTLLQQKGKVVLLDFWATWCDSCKEEIPDLMKIYGEFKDKGFEMLGISLDSSEEKLRNYIKPNNLQWKMTCSGQVWNDPTVVRYGVNSLPSLWLIDKKGILRSFDIKGEELRQAIITLLAEQ